MTSEEAIKYLKKMKDECNDTFHKVRYVTREEALDMAIKALEQEPKTGHWIEDDMTYCGVELVNYKCDKCGEMGGAWRKGLKPDKLPKYCMNCGAKMLPTDSEKE
jgi:hypothetical protein